MAWVGVEEGGGVLGRRERKGVCGKMKEVGEKETEKRVEKREVEEGKLTREKKVTKDVNNVSGIRGKVEEKQKGYKEHKLM